MSKVPSRSKLAPPKPVNIPQPETSQQPPSRVASSQSGVRKKSSKSSTINAPPPEPVYAKKAPPPKPPQPKKVHPVQKKEFTLPAFSTTFATVDATGTELEKLKKKTIRRNAPPGEDLNAIKEILRSLKESPETTVQEFIALIGPSVTDRGEALRLVMNEDLQSFRKLARKVYDMITQDNSDVLLNQQLQLVEYYKEKKLLLHEKMMRAIAEIYDMAPNFDFERFAKDGDKYLSLLFPLPAEIKVQPEEIEMLKRQQAYHRLQWLRSEGERLNAENNSLRKRLHQMKKLHLIEQQKMAEKEREAEEKRAQLEAAEAEKQETLDQLNQSLEKTIIRQELTIRRKKDANVLDPKKREATGAVPKKKKSKTSIKRRPKWNECAASEIEEKNIEEFINAEGTRTRSPFHFSPVKTPPRREPATKERSPFHFSPIKTPPLAGRAAKAPSPFHYSPPREAARAASPPPPPQQAAAPAAAPAGRRSLAPRDTWGGFY